MASTSKVSACLSISRTKCRTEHPFNILEAFLVHHELALHLLARYLSPTDLLVIYSISRRLHTHINTHYVTFVVTSARNWACLPASSRDFYAAITVKTPNIMNIFPFTSYRHLCVHEPATMNDATMRIVPSLKYLQFLVQRCNVVREIIILLGAEGHRLPLPAGAAALAKLWAVIDNPRNASRVAMMQNRAYWSDADIELASMFLLKLDMHFTDPLVQLSPATGIISNGGAAGLRAMMMAQKSLTVLWRVLKREQLTNHVDLVRMIARWRFKPTADMHGMSVFGVPPEELGILEKENWGREEVMPTMKNPNGSETERDIGTPENVQLQTLLRPDELIMMEGLRRGLCLSGKYVTMMLHGWMDPDTLKDAPMPLPDVVDEILKNKPQ